MRGSRGASRRRRRGRADDDDDDDGASPPPPPRRSRRLAAGGRPSVASAAAAAAPPVVAAPQQQQQQQRRQQPRRGAAAAARPPGRPRARPVSPPMQLQALKVDRRGDSIVLYETPELRFIVRRERLRQAHHIAADNHHYRIRIEQRTRAAAAGPFLLVDCLDLITRGIAALIRMLQREYPSQHNVERQMYINIHDEEQLNYPMFGGNQLLNRETPEAMAGRFVSQLERILRSNQEMQVAESFGIFFVVLSIRGIQERDARANKRDKKRKRKPDDDDDDNGNNNNNNGNGSGILVGGATADPAPYLPPNLLAKETNRNLLRVPEEISRAQNCLPACLLLGYWRCHAKAYDYCQNPRSWRLAELWGRTGKKLHDKVRPLCREGAIADLEHEIKLLCFSLGSAAPAGGGPFSAEDVIPAFCERFGARVDVYSNMGGGRASYRYQPPDRNPESLPLIELYEERYDGNLGVCHVSLLLKAEAFFAGAKKTRCTRCGELKPLRKKGHRHFCHAKIPAASGGTRPSMCLPCRRYELTLDTWLDADLAKDYCLKRRSEDDEIGDTPCPTCGRLLSDRDCLREHVTNVCPKLVQCVGECRKFLFIRKKDREQTLRDHVCWSKRCPLCHNTYNPRDPNDDHQCPLKEERPQTAYSNLAFFDFESVVAPTVENCQRCLLNELKKIQEDCLEREELRRRRQKLPERLKPTRASLNRRAARDEEFLASIRCPEHQGQTEMRGGAEGGGGADGSHQVNFICVLFEEKGSSRGLFSEIVFSDPEMQHPRDCRVKRAVCDLPYACGPVKPEVDSTRHDRKRGRQQQQRKKPVVVCEDEQADYDDGSDSDDDDAADYGCRGRGDVKEESSSDQHQQQQGFVSLDQLRSSGLPALDKFLLWLYRSEFTNFTFCAHSGGSYDFPLLLEAFLRHGLVPQVTTRETRILKMHFPSYNISFLDSLNYASGSLDNLAATYKIPVGGKLDFPFPYNRPDKYSYSGPYPDSGMFIKFSDNAKTVRTKKREVRARQRAGEVFNFRDQIYNYTAKDCLVLAHVVVAYLKESFELQLIFQKLFGLESVFEHPFTAPYISGHGYVYRCWKLFDLATSDHTLYRVENESGHLRTSQGEREFVLFRQWCHAPDPMTSLYTSPKQRRIGGSYTPDYVIDTPTKKICGSFNGCFFHGCADPDCTVLGGGGGGGGGGRGRRKPPAADTTNAWLGSTFGELLERTRRMLDSFNRVGFTNDAMQECRWHYLKATPPDEMDSEEDRDLARRVQHFMASVYRGPPAAGSSWAPREALRGGRCDAFVLKWDASAAATTSTGDDDDDDGGREKEKEEEEEEERFCYMDVTSMYPAVAISKAGCSLFPTGKSFTLICPDDMERLRWEDDRCYFRERSQRGEDGEEEVEKETQVFGIAHVTILPPTASELADLTLCPSDPRIRARQPLVPFLLHRVDTRCVGGLCRTCMRDKLTGCCTHDEKARALTDFYCLNELAYAVCHQGYRILDIHRVLGYRSAARIFYRFLNCLAALKVRFSGYPEHLADTREAKQAYVDEINRELDLVGGPLALSVDGPTGAVEYNAVKRSIYKTNSCALLGKLSQSQERPSLHIVLNQGELDRLFQKEDVEVKYVDPIGQAVQVTTVPRGLWVAPNPRGNCVVGAYVTSKARVYLARTFRQCHEQGAVVHYSDTDSMLLSFPKSLKLEEFLNCGYCYGQWKDEVPHGYEIVLFITLGAKNYCYILRKIKSAEEAEETDGCGGAARSASSASDSAAESESERAANDPHEEAARRDELIVVKVKGFGLKSRYAISKLDAAAFQRFLDSLLRGDPDEEVVGGDDADNEAPPPPPPPEEDKIFIPQFQMRVSRDTRKVYTSNTLKSFSHSVRNKRVVKAGSVITLPYGHGGARK